ncbi:pentapeptide repeat-containing protein [Candidatus Poribacteria bacterium]|nr:pentapeptide repeat-containing protein [Gammaproteobacteria bacterium]MYF97748.1 pentapeptide repeat-containing protein [Candidatus Poribacteria bacterium]
MDYRKKIMDVIRSIHCVVKAIEPWSILLVAAALCFTLIQFNSDRKVREAILVGLVAERLEATRSLQYEREKFGRFDTGHIRMLEIMTGFGYGLSDWDLSELRLVGIELPGVSMNESDLSCSFLYNANLDGVDFTDAELSLAKLRGARIVGAVFKDAHLDYAHFRKNEVGNADFTDAKFDNTKLEHLDLGKAIGLTDSQIKNACGRDVEFPETIKVKLQKCSDEWDKEAKCDYPLPKSSERLKNISQDVSKILRKID